MRKLLSAVYGGFCYLAFLAAFLYLLGFLSNLWVPKGIDGGTSGSLAQSLLVDFWLIALFGLQHSIMARSWFKRRWYMLVSPALERSTYVLITSAILALMFTAWQPMASVVWHVAAPFMRALVWALFVAGAALCLAATFMIDHFDLFGLRQVLAYWRGRRYKPPGFRVTWLYGWVRHPLYLGFLLLFWATPDMTLGHLVFATGMTLYLFIGMWFEERDLLAAFGTSYAKYQRRVPAILPSSRRHSCPIHGGSGDAG